MSEQIFRKKSLDRVSSPEQLNEYIRVSNPGVWMALIAAVILLVGICVWGLTGHLDTKLSVVAIAEDGNLTAYVREADLASVEAGMEVQIDEKVYAITDIASAPVVVDDSFSEYVRHLGELQDGEWVFAVKVSGSAADGAYRADIVIDRVSPIAFVLN